MSHFDICFKQKNIFFIFWPFFYIFWNPPSTKLLKLSVYFFNELALKSAFQPSTYSLILFSTGGGGRRTPPASLYIFRPPSLYRIKGTVDKLELCPTLFRGAFTNHSGTCLPLNKTLNFLFKIFFSCGCGLSHCCLDTGFTVYQVLVEQEDIQKTAIITPSGMFEFLVMPFGLRNTSNTFQRLMEQILKGL